MKNFIYRHEGNFGFLTFFGNITADREDELREALIVSIHNSESLVVNFKRVTKLDAYCLQQICIAHRIARKMKKRLVLTGHYTEIFRRAAHEAGYRWHLGCVMN
jgi:anti-anti-sigma regulatory factor